MPEPHASRASTPRGIDTVLLDDGFMPDSALAR